MTESEGFNEAKKSLLSFANDEEIARKFKRNWKQKIKKIQVSVKKVKRILSKLIAIGSAKYERLIKDVNKKATGTKKDDNIKKESKEEETYYEDKEVDYEILDKKYPNKNRTLKDINAVYKLVMDKYQDEIPEGFDKVLWGDLMIMFNPSDEDEFWNSQQDWNWKLHSSSGIHTIITDEGIVIHMLVENKYHLKKEVLSQLLKLKLETEEDSTMALELIIFVKKQIAELEPEDSDGDEKDL
ncbi:hypothetical protein Tco_0937172 [Tanacetum coccineum]|uniref:Uncharacterized protein n=1 Tax=Tanacetum coccineum TaxID=301880 RepID=A0ABQ5DG56_9ASTR